MTRLRTTLTLTKIVCSNFAVLRTTWLWFEILEFTDGKSPKLDLTITVLLPQQPLAPSLGVDPTMEDMMGVIRGMPNWKAVGPDSFPAQVLSSTTLSLSGTFIIYLSMCGEREKFPNSGKMRPSNSSIKRRVALTATTTEGFRLLPNQAKYCWKW